MKSIENYRFGDDGSVEIRTYYDVPPAEDAVAGDLFSEYLPGMAQQMKRVAVINSMYSTQGAHEQGQYFMHTSYQKRGTISHPSLASWVMKTSGRINKDLPGSVVINGGNAAIGSGFLESRQSLLESAQPLAHCVEFAKARTVPIPVSDRLQRPARSVDARSVDRLADRRTAGDDDTVGDRQVPAGPGFAAEHAVLADGGAAGDAAGGRRAGRVLAVAG